MKKADKTLSFIEHLEELRLRTIKLAIIIMIAFCFSCLWSDKLLMFLIQPIGTLVFISPSEAFISHMMVALFMSLGLSSPAVLYHIWQFIAYGITNKEKKYLGIFTGISIALFILGVLFSYFIIVPIALKFLMGFSSSSIIPMITVSKYIGFIGVTVLIFGIVCELPLVIIFLTRIGVVTPDFLSQKRRHVIVIIFIISAFATPPDCITQIMMALPLLALYEISLLFSKVTYKSKVK